MANYLYNGVGLPALPGDYPVLLIHRNKFGSITPHTLYAADSLVYRESTDGTYDVGFSNVLGKWRYVPESSVDGVWEPQEITSINPYWLASVDSDNLFWTNTDILDKDGTVVLAASEPVPVTDHNARIMGWIVGKRLAAQRGRA